MNKKQARSLALPAALFAALVSALPAAQAASTWNLDSAACQAVSGSGYGNSATCAASSGTGTVSIYAWGGADSTGSTGYQTAYLSPQSTSYGFGVKSQFETTAVGSPNHSMDNDPSTSVTPDLIVLKFDTAVALDKVTLGWSQSDADITVMAYTGAVSGTTDAAKMASFISGKNAGNLTATAGWSLVENEGDKDAGAGYGNNSSDIAYTVNDGSAIGKTAGAKNVTSSWWVISAYNSGFGGGTLDSLLDYTKLLAISSKDVTAPATVPEPGSLALAGLALFGLVYSRRQAQRKR